MTPARPQFSLGTSWIMTCRFVGFAPACSTIASVIARTSAFFCSDVRPVHICTVTTGILRFLQQYLLNPLANAAPLAGADRHRCAAAQSAAPDSLQPEPLRRIEIDAARWRRQINDECRSLELRQHVLADDAGWNRGEEQVKAGSKIGKLFEPVRRRPGDERRRALLRISCDDSSAGAERHEVARQHGADRALSDHAGICIVYGDVGVFDNNPQKTFDDCGRAV